MSPHVTQWGEDMKSTVRGFLRVMGMTLFLSVGLAMGAPVAKADTVLCSGNAFSTCINRGFTAHGYEDAYGSSHWRAASGHNCTNYVGYMLKQNGDSGPG